MYIWKRILQPPNDPSLKLIQNFMISQSNQYTCSYRYAGFLRSLDNQMSTISAISTRP
jgi:hypothetical protein